SPWRSVQDPVLARRRVCLCTCGVWNAALWPSPVPTRPRECHGDRVGDDPERRRVIERQATEALSAPRANPQLALEIFRDFFAFFLASSDSTGYSRRRSQI